MGKYSFETDEAAFYKAVKGKPLEEASEKRKIKSRVKLYEAMVEKLSEFLEDEEALEKAKTAFVKFTYLSRCPDETDDFDGETFETAKKSAEKRFSKKLHQIEQLIFYHLSELEEGFSEKIEKISQQEKEIEDLKKKLKRTRTNSESSTAEKKARGGEKVPGGSAIGLECLLQNSKRSKRHRKKRSDGKVQNAH